MESERERLKEALITFQKDRRAWLVVPRLGKDGFYSFLSFENSFEFSGFPCSCSRSCMFSNLKTHFWLLLTIFGTGTRIILDIDYGFIIALSSVE
jgi:hypothetical protein